MYDDQSAFPLVWVDNLAFLWYHVCEVITMHPDTINRFWQKVNKTDNCWLWTASKRHKGYGAFVWADDEGRIIQGRAHRFAWIILVGAIPRGMMVLHKCDNPACVNPAHLFLGTNQDNVNDMMRKGRHVNGGTYRPGNYERGERHRNAKLTTVQVLAIRQDAEMLPYTQLAAKYNLTVGHIHRIVTRKAWKHLD